jgi:DNA polymerase III subunit gamma/tau
MNNQIFARKWRPKSFKEVVGQDHVLRPLVNALKQKKIHPAYLFTGTRGVGKTTLGRILAKALNCEKGITQDPCNQCKNCQDITQGYFPDFFEIDAASHTKVEDTRTLLANISYAPIQGQFKVYLIDEVHMLSTHSFNALLKALEEPPEHIAFILATTDPEKIPETILSRCLPFYLKAFSAEKIQSHLAYILDQENIQYEKEALFSIAIAAKGSLRDALTLLNQCAAYAQSHPEQTITNQDVATLLGSIDSEYLLKTLEGLKTQNGNQLMEITEKLSEKGANFEQFLESLSTMVHQLTLMDMAPDTQTYINPKLKPLAYKFKSGDLQKWYQILISGQQEISLAPTPKIGVDMTLLRMLSVSFIKQNKAKTAVEKMPCEEKKEPLTIQKKQDKKNHQNDDIKAIMKAFNAKLLETT